jgi:hypothetical protein
MLTHAQIWNALDRLAARAGLSASGLAKKAGLDPTTFNKSKRITPDGHARWPSTESVAKSLVATGTPIDIFVQLIGDGSRPVHSQSVPMIGFSQAAKAFDAAGFPAGDGWDEISLPAVRDEHAYALEIGAMAWRVVGSCPARSIAQPARVIAYRAATSAHPENRDAFEAPGIGRDRSAHATSTVTCRLFGCQ